MGVSVGARVGVCVAVGSADLVAVAVIGVGCAVFVAVGDLVWVGVSVTRAAGVEEGAGVGVLLAGGSEGPAMVGVTVGKGLWLLCQIRQPSTDRSAAMITTPIAISSRDLAYSQSSSQSYHLRPTVLPSL